MSVIKTNAFGSAFEYPSFSKANIKKNDIKHIVIVETEKGQARIGIFLRDKSNFTSELPFEDACERGYYYLKHCINTISEHVVGKEEAGEFIRMPSIDDEVLHGCRGDWQVWRPEDPDFDPTLQISILRAPEEVPAAGYFGYCHLFRDDNNVWWAFDEKKGRIKCLEDDTGEDGGYPCGSLFEAQKILLDGGYISDPLTNKTLEEI